MPSPAKRTQRPRRDSARKELVSERPETSSPSRPAKRRKKVEDDSPREIVEDEGSSLAADESTTGTDYDSIVSRVAQHLVTPSNQPVQASKDHSNAIHESNKAGVQAYAKIAAQDWTFYVTKLAVNIGRSSDPPPHHPDDENDEDYVHIDLGPSKMISRQHALIFFSSKDEKWFLRVKGRNGVKIDGNPLKQGESIPLASGEVVEISGIEMMFVLPSEINDLHIHPMYLQRAGLSRDDIPSPVQTRSVIRPESLGGSSSPPVLGQGKLSRGHPSQQVLAPAPPDYKRPGTPPSAARRAAQALQAKSPAFRGSGTMLMSASDVDLSLDENQNIKPQYSYAQMITQAIMNTPDGKLNLNGIYNFIMSKYSYYRHQQAAGWQNSIRHNLSLNKAFEKVARSTDEPGKGMKWQIVAEVRDEMIRNAYRGGRGGHRGSSNPSSPNQLNYITQGPRDMAAKDPGSARKRKVSPSGSPQPRSSLRTSHMTPDRSRRFESEDTTLAGDGSPLPRLRKPGEAGPSGLVQGTPRSPTLTSSFLQDEGTSFVTPAPHRVHPKLAPPSTAQRPSQHMPTSSPAPFWKYADIGSTPLKPAQFDMSPSKALGPVPESSSPPPAPHKSPVASPTRGARVDTEEPPKTEEVEEDGGFDLTKGFQSIGSYHAPASRGLPVATAMNGEP